MGMGIFLWTNGLMGLIKNRTKNMGTWVDGYLNVLAVFFSTWPSFTYCPSLPNSSKYLLRGCFEPLEPTLDLEVFGSLNTDPHEIFGRLGLTYGPLHGNMSCNSRETNFLVWRSPKTKKLRHVTCLQGFLGSDFSCYDSDNLSIYSLQ